jgi:hypothetical protein
MPRAPSIGAVDPDDPNIPGGTHQVACTSRIDKLDGTLGPVGALDRFLQDRRRLAGHPDGMVQGTWGAELHLSRRSAQHARQGCDEAGLGGRRRARRATMQVRAERVQQRQNDGHQVLVSELRVLLHEELLHEDAARRGPRTGAERLAGRGRVGVAHRSKGIHHVDGEGARPFALEGGAQQLDQPRHRAGAAGRSREADGMPRCLGAAARKRPDER